MNATTTTATDPKGAIMDLDVNAIATAPYIPEGKGNDYSAADPGFWFDFQSQGAHGDWFRATYNLYTVTRQKFYDEAKAAIEADNRKRGLKNPFTKTHHDTAIRKAKGQFELWRYEFESTVREFNGTTNTKFEAFQEFVNEAAEEVAEADATKARQQDLADWLRKETWSEFATDLAAFFDRKGFLTEKQERAAQSMRDKVEARRQAEAAAPKAEGLDLSGLRSGRYAVPNGDTRLKIKVEQGKPGTRWEGWTFVKDAAEYGDGQRYGMQRPGQTYQGKVEDALRAIVADPKEAMAAYGRLVGACGACGRVLEDEASVAAGIGPICAQGW